MKVPFGRAACLASLLALGCAPTLAQLAPDPPAALALQRTEAVGPFLAKVSKVHRPRDRYVEVVEAVVNGPYGGYHADRGQMSMPLPLFNLLSGASDPYGPATRPAVGAVYEVELRPR